VTDQQAKTLSGLAGQPGGPDQVATSLLAHLAVLDGRHDGKDAPR
jgi:hypothetical protein